MVRNSKSKVSLEGVFCLPTSSRAHVHEPRRSMGFKEGQELFILTATQSLEEGGYPYQVVLAADEGQIDWSVGQEVKTQHAQVRKNLPPRMVTGIVRANGTVQGDLPAKGFGLPHWSFIPTTLDGNASQSAINAVDELLKANKENSKAEKEAVRNSKKGNARATA